MNNKIVHELEPITLLGGGAIGPHDLSLARQIAPVVVAVDGGARHALAQQIDMAAVMGDLDSISATALAQIPADRVHLIDDQATTDFDKALRSVSSPLVIAVGFTGGRIDHQLAAFHTLVARAAQPCILLGADEIVFLCPPAIDLATQVGDVVSLFPMTPVTGRSTGLEWCIDGLSFDPAHFIGTSNRALGAVRLEMDQPGMLVILKRAAILPVARSLARCAPQERWPAP